MHFGCNILEAYFGYNSMGIIFWISFLWLFSDAFCVLGLQFYGESLFVYLTIFFLLFYESTTQLSVKLLL